MGEIIVRPLPQVPLAFTGERLTSEYAGQTEIEHLHRYLLARAWCRGKDVLDVASGEGYGTSMLSQVARTAVGVEIAPDAVAHASRSYVRDNLQYLAGDARALPLDDASMDVVVSFETIEHFAEQGAFLREVRRVLRPDGVIIVSTPDRDNYSPAETSANPYHVQELTGPEFLDLLSSNFQHVSMVAQRPVFGSLMLAQGGSAVAPLCFERRGSDHFEGSVGMSRPQYFVAFASNAPLSDVPDSVYIETGRLGMQTPAQAEARIALAEQALGAQEERHAAALDALGRQSEDEMGTTRAALAEARSRADALERALESTTKDIEACRLELAATRGEVKGLLAAAEAAERAGSSLRTALAREAADAQRARDALAQAEAEAERARTPGVPGAGAGGDPRYDRSPEGELAELRSRLSLSEATVSSLLQSTSWRTTAPLRAVSRLLLRRR